MADMQEKVMLSFKVSLFTKFNIRTDEVVPATKKIKSRTAQNK